MIRDPFTDLPEFADVEDAAERLHGVTVRTPLLRNDVLDERVGAPVWIKPESLQRTGSFKVRGAFNRISRIPEEVRARGVVAFSSGNHAQGVAYAARLLGLPATIVMPSDAPASKVEGTRRLGAKIRLYDRANESREDIGAEISRTTGATLVKPYDDAWVIAGQGTAALEAIDDAAAAGVTFERMLCGASGGGLLAGGVLAFGARAPDAKIFVVEPEAHDDHARSLAAGPDRADRCENAPGHHSIADALMAPTPGELTYRINGPRVAGGFAVSDADILGAMRFAFEHLKLVLEPGGAVSLAAVLARPETVVGAGPILLIATGGNVDAAMFQRALDGPPAAQD